MSKHEIHTYAGREIRQRLKTEVRASREPIGRHRAPESVFDGIEFKIDPSLAPDEIAFDTPHGRRTMTLPDVYTGRHREPLGMYRQPFLQYRITRRAAYIRLEAAAGEPVPRHGQIEMIEAALREVDGDRSRVEITEHLCFLPNSVACRFQTVAPKPL